MVGYGLTLATGIPHPDTIKDLGTAARSLIGKGAQDVSPEAVATLVEGSDEFLREVAEDNAPEQMHAFREEFAKLLEDAEIDRLIVLVDDLDRCLPDTAIETLEAIRLFLFVPRAAFVIAADEGMIEYAVRQHFPDLPVATGPATYARNYLEKLIQVPFRLTPAHCGGAPVAMYAPAEGGERRRAGCRTPGPWRAASPASRGTSRTKVRRRRSGASTWRGWRALRRAQAMLHDFVEGCVRDQFDARGTDLGDLNAGAVDSFVDDLYAAALDLVEALGDDE